MLSGSLNCVNVPPFPWFPKQKFQFIGWRRKAWSATNLFYNSVSGKILFLSCSIETSRLVETSRLNLRIQIRAGGSFVKTARGLFSWEHLQKPKWFLWSLNKSGGLSWETTFLHFKKEENRIFHKNVKMSELSAQSLHDWCFVVVETCQE